MIELPAAVVTAFRNARIGLRMWSMGTDEIDGLIGPMTEEDRDAARRARGMPLGDDPGCGVAALGSSSAGASEATQRSGKPFAETVRERAAVDPEFRRALRDAASKIDYGYYWWRHHSDGSTFIACRDEGDGLWYMPGLDCPIIAPELSATLLGPVPRMVAGGGSIDQ